MIQSRPLEQKPKRRIRPHRLAAQDVALSRPKPGFESPWGHPNQKAVQQVMLSGFCLC